MPANAKNLVQEAAGSIREARRLILQHVSENRITAENAEQIRGLLQIREGLEKTQLSLEMGARTTKGE